MAEYINRERARFEAKRYFKNMDEIQEDKENDYGHQNRRLS